MTDTGRLTHRKVAKAQMRIIGRIRACTCGCAEIVDEELGDLLEADTAYERNRDRDRSKTNNQDVHGTPSSRTTSPSNAPMGRPFGAGPIGAAHDTAPPPEEGAAGSARAPEKREKTVIPLDWKPSQDDCVHVIDRGIRGDELAAIAESFVTEKAEAGTESYCWSATWRRYCDYRIATGMKKVYPAIRPRFRPGKKGATGLAGGDSRTKVTKGSSTALVPASGAPVGEFRVYEGSPEAEAWAAYKGGKLSFPKPDLDLGKNYRVERTQWPLNHLDLENRNGSWG